MTNNMAHYCIGSPCKICFPDPNSMETASTSNLIHKCSIEQLKSSPNLGLATTQELLEELMARARVGGYDQYRTVDPQ